MKHIYPILIACAATAISANAQSKIDLQGRMLLQQLESTQVEKTIPSRDLFAPMSMPNAGAITKATPLSTIVLLNDGYTAADLEAAGYEVISNLNSVALVNVSATQVEKMAELNCVRQVAFGRTLKPLLDVATANYGLTDIHAGNFTHNGTSYKFTGKGVCTGIYDIGIAPNHVAFRDADGNSRVKQLTYYYVDSEDNEIYWGEVDMDKISEFQTDTNEESHGTHTAGIMAGGYDGLVKYVYVEPTGDSFRDEVRVENNIFKGVAPESDILMSAGVLQDATSLHGFERMAKYAKDNGQPCVINYSVGSIMGPHDGTDAFSQGISEIANEYGAIFCLAAGNDGEGKLCVSKTFLSAGESLQTCVTPNADYSETVVNCYVDIWGSDEKPFTVAVNSYRPKKLLGKASDTKLFELTEANQGINIACVSGMSGVEYCDQLAKDFGDASSNTSGLAQIIAMSELNELNNRYHVMLLILTKRENYNSYIHLNIQGQPGTTVDANLYNVGELTAQSTTTGSVDGDDHNTINDAACNADVISVGATYNRRYRTNLGGQISYYKADEFNANVRAPFSSYGTTGDGRQVPEVLAPGADMISAYNGYYVSNVGAVNSMTAGAVDDAESTTLKDCWGAMSGTSMSSPFVAGTIALWLEADPTLTVTDVKEIIAKTSTMDASLEGQEGKCGYGRIDPAKGLIEVLNRNVMGIEDINGDPERNLIITQNGSMIEVFYAGEKALTATLFNTQGAAVVQAKANDSTVTTSTSSLIPGIYILRVEGASGKTATRKVVVK